MHWLLLQWPNLTTVESHITQHKKTSRPDYIAQTQTMWGPRKHKHLVTERTETSQDMKTEFIKEIETLKRTQAETKMELKNAIPQLENMGDTF